MVLLKNKHFVLIVTACGLLCCKKVPSNLSEVNAIQITIDSSAQQIDSIDNFVAPFRERINSILDSTLAYAPKTLNKNDGHLNSSIGNLMADIVYEKANPIFKSRTGQNIDFVVLNHGGIRAIISEGPVNARTAYQVMPFENYIVVVGMSGEAVDGLLSFLAGSKRAHPIAGMKLAVTEDGAVASAQIKGKPFDKNATYFVATSDYLVQGGDNMGFFGKRDSVYTTDYLLRNAIIDYFKDVDTLAAKVDDRFIELN